MVFHDYRLVFHDTSLVLCFFTVGGFLFELSAGAAKGDVENTAKGICLYLGPTIMPARPCWPKAIFGLVRITMRIDDGQAALTASLPRLSLHVPRLGCPLKD